ncbi:MAG: RHS repeat-associated core domain-containing protein [bacterium]|nr:RHS repeat-associated core domain-containing protein [bacterium]
MRPGYPAPFLRPQLRLLAVLALLSLAFFTFAPPSVMAQTSARILITSNLDTTANDGVCTLREAIRAVNENQPSGTAAGECAAGADQDTVDFGDVRGEILLTSPLPVIQQNVILRGPGWLDLSLRRASDVASPFRILHVRGAAVTIQGIAMLGGSTGSGGGIYNEGGTLTLRGTAVLENTATSSGGGLYNEGGIVLIERGSRLENNTAGSSGGAVYNRGGTVTFQTEAFVTGNTAQSSGGGIYNANNGKIFISQTTIRGNSAVGSGGGLHNAAGEIGLAQSLFSGNSAVNGAGVFNAGAGSISSTTFSGNRASSAGGGLYTQSVVSINYSTFAANAADQTGGAVYSSAAVNLSNSILAYSTAGGNCAGAVNSAGYNIADDASCNLAGTGDRPATNPLLDPIASDNGGFTLSHALLPGSPALDTANPQNCTAPQSRDQRGVFRGLGSGCDIGAFERLPYAEETVVTGRILDANDAEMNITTPLRGALVRHIQTGLFVRTDANGYFRIAGLPPGEGNSFDFDGRNAYPYDTYGAYRSLNTLRTDMVNDITRPIYLMKIDWSSATRVNPNGTTVVYNPTLNMTVTIPPGTVETEEGTLYEGEITISQVPERFTPGSLPDTLEPGLVISVQPMGLTFNGFASLTFPNFDGLEAGSQVDLWSMSHATGQFIEVGRGRVSDDGLMITTLPGGGIQESSWHFPLPPRMRRGSVFPRTGGNRNTCAALYTASAMDVRSGSLATGFALPAYVSQGEARGLEFVYTTDRAYPYPIVPIDATIETRSTLPNLLSFDLRGQNGAASGPFSFMNTVGLREDFDETVRGAAGVDARSMPTSIYAYDFNLTSRFLTSNITSRETEQVMVVNGRSSPYGIGWGISGLQQLYDDNSQDLLWTDGSGASMIFSESRRGEGIGDGLRMQMFDLENPAEGVRTNFAGLTPGAFSAITPDMMRSVNQFVVPSVNFGQAPESIFYDTFHYFGPNGVLESTVPNMPQGDDISFQPPGDNDFFGALFTGYLYVPQAGEVTFTVGVDDVFELRIDGQTILGRYEETFFRDFTSPPVSLPQGYVPISLSFAEYRGSAFVVLSASGGGLPGGVIPTQYLYSVLPEDSEVIYEGPEGDYTTILKRLNDTYTRFYLDGSRAEFNAQGYQTAFIDRNGNETVFAYDANNRLVRVTDPVGLSTQLVYTGSALSRVIDPDGRQTDFTHDAEARLTAVEFPDDSTMGFGYDGEHLMISETDPRGQTTERVYDPQGRLVSAELPGGTQRQTTNAQSVGFGGTENAPLPVIRPEDGVTTYTDFPAGAPRTSTYEIGPAGYVNAITNPVDQTVRIERDADGNPTAVTLPSGARVNMTYDENGNLRTITDQQAGGTTTFTYEPNFNQVKNIQDPFNQLTTFEYDAEGNLVGVSSPLSRALEMTYDGAGLLTSLTDTLGTVTEFDYNARGNVTQISAGMGADQRQLGLTYTPQGYVETITDPEGRDHRFEYDSFGRIVEETLPGGRVVEYTYDEAGNLRTITTPSDQVHELTYRADGLPEAYIAPAVTGGGTNTTTYAYNGAQELTTITRPEGDVITFAYDAAGRPDTVTMPRNGATTTLDMTYDGVGRLTAVAAPDAVDVGFIYNAGWEVPNRIEMPAGEAVTGSVSYTYDADYRVTEISVNDANPVGYTYDADGAITAAGALALDYDNDSGLLTTTTLGSVSDEIAYNVHGEPTDYIARFGGSTLYDVEYTRDGLGRITRLVESIAGTTRTYDFAYDTAGRLATVELNNQVIGSYQYDANGNRTEANGIDATYDAQDRLLTFGGISYTYTPSGELLTRTENGQTTNYTYDVLGNLIGVSLPNGTQITYLIDTLNRRVGKQVNGTLVQGFIYQDGLEPIAELDGQGNVVSRFVYGSQAHVPDYMVRGGVTYRFITDHLGSVRLVVDAATGSVAQRLDYDAWGNVTLDSSPGFQPFGYAGGIYDADTGLVRFGARDYDPEVGRWTSKDPIGFAAGDANLYAYVFNDPVNWLDRSGSIAVLAIANKAAIICAQLNSCVNGVSYALFNDKFPSPNGLIGAVIAGGIEDIADPPTLLDNFIVGSYAKSIEIRAEQGHLKPENLQSLLAAGLISAATDHPVVSEYLDVTNAIIVDNKRPWWWADFRSGVQSVVNTAKHVWNNMEFDISGRLYHDSGSTGANFHFSFQYRYERPNVLQGGPICRP